MNTLRNILIGASAAALLAGFAGAASAADATATTSVTVLRAITIAKDADLAFGTIVRPAAPATVTLNTAGAVSGVTTVGGGTTAAQFTVNGEGNQTFSIAEVATLAGPSASSLTLTLSKIATTGSVSTGVAGGTGTLDGSLGGAGVAVIKYGASFPITATTTTGAYTGSLTVTVDYN